MKPIKYRVYLLFAFFYTLFLLVFVSYANFQIGLKEPQELTIALLDAGTLLFVVFSLIYFTLSKSVLELFTLIKKGLK